MIDPVAAIRAHLVAQPALTAYTGTDSGETAARIWGSADWEAGYTPADGPAILFKERPGGQWPGSDKITAVSVQYQIAAESEDLAREVARTLFAVLNGQGGAGIKLSGRETHDQLLPPPEPGWHVVFVAYTHWLIDTD